MATFEGWRKLWAARLRAFRSKTVSKGGMKLKTFEVDGVFRYDLYEEVQVAGNKAKLDWQWVPKEHIDALSDYLMKRSNAPMTGVCHGTRRGNEQVWFMERLPEGSDVFGTEISDTATDFPRTIQWDFHQSKEEWVRAFDFVYSNSWDHTYDPELLFRTWAETLKPGGYMLVDHGWSYQPGRVNALDPFGISEEGLVKLLNRVAADYGEVTDVILGGKWKKKHQIRTIVFTAKPAQS